ncbi:hypothetical protein [Actinoplanes sp. NPDC026670]|uniref:hypothetical protein n=1 Tax=Actinoplanes sp. NPDC026670 TaxID=3154700 RepID=UPI0033F856A3
MLSATPAETRVPATARDRVEEERRGDQVPVVRAIPRQPPGGVIGFTGRDTVLAKLDDLAEEAKNGRTAVIAAVSGTAGAGKPGPTKSAQQYRSIPS